MLLTKKVNDIVTIFNNQYFYSEKVNTYLINLKDKVVLFDLPTYSKKIEDFILSFKKPPIAILSHGSCGIEDGTIWQKKLDLKIYLQENDKNSQWLEIKPDILFNNPPNIFENLDIILTPGHTPGSICLYEKSTNCLFTGDTFGGEKNGEVWDFFKKDGLGNLKQRLESCRGLLKYDFTKVLPFHYEIILDNAKNSLTNFVNQYS